MVCMVHFLFIIMSRVAVFESVGRCYFSLIKTTSTVYIIIIILNIHFMFY